MFDDAEPGAGHATDAENDEPTNVTVDLPTNVPVAVTTLPPAPLTVASNGAGSGSWLSCSACGGSNTASQFGRHDSRSRTTTGTAASAGRSVTIATLAFFMDVIVSLAQPSAELQAAPGTRRRKFTTS
jgi:hypothetical protein